MITPDVTSSSPNQSAGQPSKRVIIHATRSGVSMNPSEFNGTLNWFASPASQVSAHWVIGRDGRKARVVPDNAIAWHAAEHNDAFGIELEQGAESDGFTEKQVDSLLEISRHYIVEYGVEPVHIQDITQSGFVGHQETPQGLRVGKSDPGSLFNWGAFIASLEEDMALTDGEKDEIRRIARDEIEKHKILAIDEGTGNKLTGVHTLPNWMAVLHKHNQDAIKHTATVSPYTDAQAVKAVKDKL